MCMYSMCRVTCSDRRLEILRQETLRILREIRVSPVPYTEKYKEKIQCHICAGICIHVIYTKYLNKLI